MLAYRRPRRLPVPAQHRPHPRNAAAPQRNAPRALPPAPLPLAVQVCPLHPLPKSCSSSSSTRVAALAVLRVRLCLCLCMTLGFTYLGRSPRTMRLRWCIRHRQHSAAMPLLLIAATCLRPTRRRLRAARALLRPRLSLRPCPVRAVQRLLQPRANMRHLPQRRRRCRPSPRPRLLLRPVSVSRRPGVRGRTQWPQRTRHCQALG